MEAEAREISRLVVKAADMSRHTALAAQRSRRAVDATDWSGRAVEAVWMSRRATNAAEMSSHAATTWENVSRVDKDSHRRMCVMLDDLMARISDWMKLQDEMNASFESATGIIRD